MKNNSYLFLAQDLKLFMPQPQWDGRTWPDNKQSRSFHLHWEFFKLGKFCAFFSRFFNPLGAISLFQVRSITTPAGAKGSAFFGSLPLLVTPWNSNTMNKMKMHILETIFNDLTWHFWLCPHKPCFRKPGMF